MTETTGAPDARRLSQPEFIALMAMLAATIAFSIDAMLPALPAIGAELGATRPNAEQLVLVGFVLGMGLGTVVVGPLSDAFGRKPVMLAGAAIYCVAAAVATMLPTLEGVVAARIVQGIGAAGPRVAAIAMIRDLYAGRGMARITSYVMMGFTLVPAVAPLIGAVIIEHSGWRGVFWAFVVFSVISGAWLSLRQPETLPPERRRPLDLSRLASAAREVARHPLVRRATLVQSLVFAILFGTLTSVQAIYERIFDKGESFPLWFGLVALISGLASILNAQLVGRLGMVALLRAGLLIQSGLSAALWLLWPELPEAWTFPIFVAWQVGAFALAGLTIGNLNALAMQPMGHVAGMASSLVSATATVLGVTGGALIGQAFDGTLLPLYAGVAVAGGLALLLSRSLREAG